MHKIALQKTFLEKNKLFFSCCKRNTQLLICKNFCSSNGFLSKRPMKTCDDKILSSNMSEKYENKHKLEKNLKHSTPNKTEKCSEFDSLEKISTNLANIINKKPYSLNLQSTLKAIHRNQDNYKNLSQNAKSRLLYYLSKIKSEEKLICDLRKEIAIELWKEEAHLTGNQNLKDLLIVLWSSIKLDIKDFEKQSEIILKLLNDVEKMNHHDLSSFLYCCAKISEYSDQKEILFKLFYQNETKIHQLKQTILKILNPNLPQNIIINIIWGIDKMKLANPDITNTITELITKNNIILDDNNLRILANSSIHLNITSQEYYNFIKLEYLKRFDRLDCEKVFSILRVLISSKLVNFREILSSKENDFQILLKKDPLIGAPTLAFSLANAHLHLRSTIDVLLSVSYDLVTKFRVEDLSLILYSLVVLNEMNNDFFYEGISIISKQKYEEMGKQMLNQVGQIYLELVSNQNSNKLNSFRIKENYLKIKTLLTDKILAPRQRDFSKTKDDKEFDIHNVLSSLGIQIIPEYVLEIYNIDIAIINLDLMKIISLKQRISEANDSLSLQQISSISSFNTDCQPENKIYLEIDGDSHYIPGTNIKRGGSILKIRQLGYLGYNIITITKEKCYEISQICSEKERAIALLDYLEQKLKIIAMENKNSIQDRLQK